MYNHASSTINPFASALMLSYNPQEEQRQRDLYRATCGFVIRHIELDTRKSNPILARAMYGKFWCDALDCVTYNSPEPFEDDLRIVLDRLRDCHRRQLPCGDAHAAFFGALLFHLKREFYPYFDGLWSTGFAFTLPNDPRAIEAALPLLGRVVFSTDVHSRSGGEAMARHLRQLHYRPAVNPLVHPSGRGWCHFHADPLTGLPRR